MLLPPVIIGLLIFLSNTCPYVLFFWDSKHIKSEELAKILWFIAFFPIFLLATLAIRLLAVHFLHIGLLLEVPCFVSARRDLTAWNRQGNSENVVWNFIDLSILSLRKRIGFDWQRSECWVQTDALTLCYGRSGGFQHSQSHALPKVDLLSVVSVS